MHLSDGKLFGHQSAEPIYSSRTHHPDTPPTSLSPSYSPDSPASPEDYSVHPKIFGGGAKPNAALYNFKAGHDATKAPQTRNSPLGRSGVNELRLGAQESNRSSVAGSCWLRA